MAETDGNTLPAAQARPAVEIMPVPPSVFQALHEINIGFENLTRNLETLQSVPFFPHPKLTAFSNLLHRMQAETNYSLADVIREREEKNAAYYDRLCIEWERQNTDPDDVLIEAEQRKRELTENEEPE